MTAKNLRWSSFLLTAADDQFFQIMRTYLGDIKTPYNKHTLIKRLNAFLRKSESVDRILALVDTKDARVLTAIAFLDEPSIGRLFTLFEGSVRYLQLHYHILNLEERLLVYRSENEGYERIALNPLLEDELHRRIVSPGLLFPAKMAKSVSAHLSWPSDARLIATITHIVATPALLKGDGNLRKKAASVIKSVFHEDLRSAEYDGFRASVMRLIGLGVVNQLEGRLEVDLERWREFCRIDAASRRSYLAAVSLTPESPGAEVRAGTVRSVLANLPDDASLEDESMERFLRAHASQPLGDAQSKALIGSCLATGLVVRQSDGTLIRPKPPIGVGAKALLQPTFELTLPLDASAEEAWFIPLIADLRGFDTVSRYEITRSASSRAFEAGLSVADIRDLLASLCAKEVPRNVDTTIELWEQEYRSIRLVQATTVVVDESHRHLFEFDEQIQGLIFESVAPGVYLILDRDVEALRKRLEQAGVDPVPAVDITDSKSESDKNEDSRLKTLEPHETLSLSVSDDPVFSSAFQSERYHQEALEHYEQLNPTKEQRAELEERVNRRLVLFPEQLDGLQPITEVIEAKGFDYLGKIRLIEQALSSGNDLLEVIGSDESNEPTKIIVRPQELDKNEDELILVGQTLGDDKIHRIRVRTIGLLRKRRGSLLG